MPVDAQVSPACRPRCAGAFSSTPSNKGPWSKRISDSWYACVFIVCSQASPRPRRAPVRASPRSSSFCTLRRMHPWAMADCAFLRVCAHSGIGMTIESDFYATEAGRQHFSDQLTSIRCATPTTGCTPSNLHMCTILCSPIPTSRVAGIVSRRPATSIRCSLT